MTAAQRRKEKRKEKAAGALAREREALQKVASLEERLELCKETLEARDKEVQELKVERGELNRALSNAASDCQDYVNQLTDAQQAIRDLKEWKSGAERLIRAQEVDLKKFSAEGKVRRRLARAKEELRQERTRRHVAETAYWTKYAERWKAPLARWRVMQALMLLNGLFRLTGGEGITGETIIKAVGK